MQTIKKFAHLSHLGLLSVQGEDAKKFLQGQVTCNLNDITPEQSRLTAHCNLKGRMQSLFRIVELKNPSNHAQYLLVLPISMQQAVKQDLKKYALFSKVQIEECSNLQILGLDGLLPQIPSLEVDQCFSHSSNEESYTLYRIPGIPPRYEMIGQSTSIEETISQLSSQAKEISPQEWELWDIFAGLPAVFPQTIDQLLPHHVNLITLNGVSFTKGCYLGQEVIARMHYKGKIKKHLYHVLAPANSGAHAGDPIFVKDASASEAPGIVVRVAQSEQGDHLLVVLDEQHAAFDHVTLKSPEGLRLNRVD